MILSYLLHIFILVLIIKFFLLVISLGFKHELLSSFPVISQIIYLLTPGKIQGFVYNTINKKPISFALITIYDSNGKIIWFTTTNKNGVFKLNIKDKTRFIVTVNHYKYTVVNFNSNIIMDNIYPKYEPNTIVSNTQQTLINIAMMPKAFYTYYSGFLVNLFNTFLNLIFLIVLLLGTIYLKSLVFLIILLFFILILFSIILINWKTKQIFKYNIFKNNKNISHFILYNALTNKPLAYLENKSKSQVRTFIVEQGNYFAVGYPLKQKFLIKLECLGTLCITKIHKKL